ncbi:MAG: class I SAM-dependent methyltransferase [Thermoanaerobaculia bacterium]|jgi:SAM-dependent methyltransferase
MPFFKARTIRATSLVHAATADPVLADMGRELLRLDSGLGLFRLVHLVDAISRSSNPQPGSIVSIGSGGGLHETFLARLFPSTAILGVDLRDPFAGVTLPNLSFRQGNIVDHGFATGIPKADFVFSIECLEHIGDDQAFVKCMAALVKPGGSLYIQVPFASDAELADPALVKAEFEAHEHVRPGYSARQLAAICDFAGFHVGLLEGAFWFPMSPMLWFAAERFGIETLLPHWPEFLELAQRDLREAIPAHRGQATAIKVLGIKPRRA